MHHLDFSNLGHYLYTLKHKVENTGVITLVQFSDWAAPIVPVIKPDGSVRICGDNAVSKVEAYQLPRVDDLFTALSGGKLFSNLTCIPTTSIK